jgi:hypothetical protein
MRTLTITLVAALAFLLSQQLAAAPPGLDRQESGASQGVVAGAIKCFLQDFPQESSTIVSLEIGGGLGVVGLAPNFAVFADATQVGDCSELLPVLVDQVPHPICEIGSTLEPVGDDIIEVFVTCSGHTDAVISAVGKMAREVTRLGQN